MTPSQSTTYDLALSELPRPHGRIARPDDSVGLWWSADRGEWDVVVMVRPDGEVVARLTDSVPCEVHGLGGIEAAGRWLADRGVTR